MVKVAEPRDVYRHQLVWAHDIRLNHSAAHWRELADLRRFEDAVLMATPDALRAEPAIAFAQKG